MKNAVFILALAAMLVGFVGASEVPTEAVNLFLLEQGSDSSLTSVQLDAHQMKKSILPIWAGSRNSFEDQIASELKIQGDAQFYLTRAALPGAKGAVIHKVVEDDSYNLRYTAIYACEASLADAESIVEQWIVVLDDVISTKFPKSERFNSEFHKSNYWMYEYASDDFTRQAKNPTISVGVKMVRDQYIVELVVAEPVL